MPHSEPQHESSRPLVTPEQVTRDRLFVSRFISNMVASNLNERVAGKRLAREGCIIPSKLTGYSSIVETAQWL